MQEHCKSSLFIEGFCTVVTGVFFSYIPAQYYQELNSSCTTEKYFFQRTNHSYGSSNLTAHQFFFLTMKS